MKNQDFSIRELFAFRLRELRSAQQLPATRLAKMAGLREGTPGNIERTRANAELKTVAALARALHVSPESFFCDRLVRQESPPSDIELIDLFRTNVKDARLVAGMSQAHLTEAAGLHRDYIWNLEKSGANVTLDVIDALAGTLGTTAAQLFRRRETGRREGFQEDNQGQSHSVPDMIGSSGQPPAADTGTQEIVEFQEARRIFGERVRYFREARGMPALDFVKKGWRRQLPLFRLEEIESGTGDVRLELITRVCSVLEVHPASLFTYAEFPFSGDVTREEFIAHTYGRIEIFSAIRQVSHTDLARKAGLSAAFVVNMRDGKTGGMLSSVAQLAQALHVHVWQMFV